MLCFVLFNKNENMQLCLFEIEGFGSSHMCLNGEEIHSSPTEIIL